VRIGMRLRGRGGLRIGSRVRGEVDVEGVYDRMALWALLCGLMPCLLVQILMYEFSDRFT
jgi:hypothetical protein